MSDVAVCAGCGAEDTIYRDVEVTYSGWRDCEVQFEPDGSVSVTESRRTETSDVIDEDPREYCCSECSHTASNIEDMVKTLEAPAADELCACGHSGHEHPAQKNYDKTRYSRGRRACGETGCGCWEFETDPALATVVAA